MTFRSLPPSYPFAFARCRSLPLGLQQVWPRKAKVYFIASIYQPPLWGKRTVQPLRFLDEIMCEKIS